MFAFCKPYNDCHIYLQADSATAYYKLGRGRSILPL